MRAGKLLVYVLAAIGGLILLSVVVSAIAAALALLWAVLTTAITIAVLVGVVYGCYRLYSWVSGRGSASRQERASTSLGGRGRTRERATAGRAQATPARERADGAGSGDRHGGSAPADVTADVGPAGPVERAKQRYADGELSEQELERRLERELDDREPDSIDRELRRERR